MNIETSAPSLTLPLNKADEQKILQADEAIQNVAENVQDLKSANVIEQADRNSESIQEKTSQVKEKPVSESEKKQIGDLIQESTNAIINNETTINETSNANVDKLDSLEINNIRQAEKSSEKADDANVERGPRTYESEIIMI